MNTDILGMASSMGDMSALGELAGAGFVAIIILFVLYIAFIAVIIWLWYLVAREFYRIAKEKGFPQKKYLWLTFLFGMLGMLLVVALPDRGAKLQIEIPAAPAVESQNTPV